MEYTLKATSIWEIGYRPNQEDYIYPKFGEGTDNARIFILCDGMGGHERGEVASQTVGEAMGNFLRGKDFTDEIFSAAMDAAFHALDDMDIPNNTTKKPGTTLAFLCLYKKGAFIAHIGDSRIYHIRPSEHKILFQTRDHSLVNKLIDLGELTEEEAKCSSMRNVITRAMQPMQNPRPKADIYQTADIHADDYFFLCSDGMLEQMEDENLLNIVSLKDKDDEAKTGILKTVCSHNRDNHSAHLIHVLKVTKKSRFLWQ